MSVVVPVFNEEAAVAGTVTALRSWLEQSGRPWEIIVVDNASEDATVERLAPLLGDDIRLLRNEVNSGKGYSMRRGMLDARGELRLHCDADCAPSLASLPEMLKLLDSADVVAGSRLARGAQLGQRQPLRRRIVGRTFVGLCRVVLREPTRDLFCGFKLWRAEAAEAVFSRTQIDGWVFDAEALALARALGYGITETGIVWSDRAGSRLSMARVLGPVLGELLAARRQVRAAADGASRQAEALVPEPADRRP
ncbi:MAG: dolichyl-phosphate beta-glucosyltransferase [Thermoleophilaceae bacterium]|jgi:glycosyltransferase involved in cell wall biosynthesis|nr:dolichyl-phosphate beta-glucosyltransferase [Thermoleophilaceae bacterium]